MDRKNLSIFLLSTILLSGAIGILSYGTLPPILSEMEENVNDWEDQQAITTPKDSAYYLEFGYTGINAIDADQSNTLYNNTVVMDAYETSSYYYYTGYTVNISNSIRRVFLLRTDKDGNNPKYEVYDKGENATIHMGGLSVVVNETSNQAFVGGYYNYYPVGTNVWGANPSRFETYGAGLLLCWDVSLPTWGDPSWVKKIYNPSYGSDAGDFADTTGSNYDFGGERIEDVILMDDGNICVTGSIIYHKVFSGSDIKNGINYYVACYNTTGDEQWFYNSNNIGSTSDNRNPSHGKQLTYRSATNTLYLLFYKRVQANELGDPYQITSLITGINYDYGSASFIGTELCTTENSQTPLLYDYEMVYELTFNDNEDLLFAAGVVHEQDGEAAFNNTPQVWELDIFNYASIENIITLPMTNRSAQGIRFDSEDTLYLTGTYWQNTTSLTGVWYQNYDISSSFEIISEDLYALSSNSTYRFTLWDLVSSIYIYTTYYVSGSSEFQGYCYIFDARSSISSETLDSLPNYSNTYTTTLSWSNTNNALRYFYIFRSTADFGGSVAGNVPIATLEHQYSFSESLPKIDGNTYYYALVCGNDEVNATAQFDSLIYYDPVEEPVLSLNDPDYDNNIVNPGNIINISWQEINDATFEVYRSASYFDSSDIGSMTPVATPAAGVFHYYDSESTLGTYYYIVNAINGTERGETPSEEPLVVNIFERAISPVDLSLTAISLADGVVRLQWTAFPGTVYNIFASQEGAIETGYTGEYIQQIQSNYLNIEDLAEGEWWFAIMGFNESGAAVSFSNSPSITIERIPIQPVIYLSSNNPHRNSKVEIIWDAVDYADYYCVYRVFGNRVYLSNYTNLEPIYNGTATSYNDYETKNDGYYIYCVVAYNGNGNRDPNLDDNDYYVTADILLNTETSLMGDSLKNGLIIGGSILGVVVVVYIIYKKKNPWVGLDY